MVILLITFVVFMLAFAGLALGYLLAGKRLKGSCGGVGDSACGVCERPCEKRLKAQQAS